MGDTGNGFVKELTIENEYEKSWGLSRSNHGDTLTVYTPGMFVYNGTRGKYHAVSITAGECGLGCEHCKGLLLQCMPKANAPDLLLNYALKAQQRGDIGILLTGGCNSEGRLPWEVFARTISEIKRRTDLKISIHPGQLDGKTAKLLKNAGVDQALVDVMGSEETALDIYHLTDGNITTIKTMDALAESGIEIAPHVIMGIHFGKIIGEYKALEIIKKYPIRKYVVVILNPLKNTPMEKVIPPNPEEVGSFLVKARFEMPQTLASLGCARPGGKYREMVDLLAVKAGVNSIALAADKAIELAQSRGLKIRHESSCCSIN